MHELVERLRDAVQGDAHPAKLCRLCMHAADVIEQLTKDEDDRHAARTEQTG